MRPTTRRTVLVSLDDGSSFVTDINGTDDEVRRYYLGQVLNFGDTDPADKLCRVVRVEVLV